MISAADLGGKAIGLLGLPEEWTPPFIVLGASFLKIWLASGCSAVSAFAAASAEDREALVSLIRQAGQIPGAEGLIVRSNAPSELSVDSRGRYRSVDVGLEESDVYLAIDEVLGQAADVEPLFAVVQVRMNRRAAGHLSNERRVAERSSQWLIEEEDEGSGTPRAPRRIRVRDSEPLSLGVGDRESLNSALRQLACELRSAKEGRTHCEWIWDAERLWVVQLDRARTPRGGPVAEYLGEGDGNGQAADQIEGLRILRRLSSEQAAAWNKLSRRHVMEQIGLPVADVFFVPAEALASPDLSALREDLGRVTAAGSPLVIRCDLAGVGGEESLSLPTSPPLLAPDRLICWMQEEAEDFSNRGLSLSDVAFLPALLVPARASVMVQARPGGQLVRLDALWGFPDGVGCLPHDSYFHHLASSRVETRRVYKGTCLLWSESPGWNFEAVPAPFDWAPVLDAEEVLTASNWARSLAEHLGREVQLMALARIDGRRGPTGMVPWHYTDHVVPTLRSTVAFAPAGGVITVRDPPDLDAPDPWPRQGVFFRPTAGEYRDRVFVAAVGERAAREGVPLFFEGSVLGHSFYLLGAAGAQVITVGGQVPTVRAEDYNKLVRDRIPEIVSEGGGGARVVRAHETQASWLLRHKLIEEAFEVWRSNGDALVEELADLSEVVRAISDHLGVDLEEVEAVRRRKREERGGFDQLLYLESTVPDASIEGRPPDEEPLFEEAAPPEPRGESTDGEGPVEVEAGDRSVLFRIPMAPPLRQGLPLNEQRLFVQDAEVRVRFSGARVEVEVVRAPDGTPHQMSLEVDNG